MNGEMDFMILNNKVKGVQGTVDNIDAKIDAVATKENIQEVKTLIENSGGGDALESTSQEILNAINNSSSVEDTCRKILWSSGQENDGGTIFSITGKGRLYMAAIQAKGTKGVSPALEMKVVVDGETIAGFTFTSTSSYEHSISELGLHNPDMAIQVPNNSYGHIGYPNNDGYLTMNFHEVNSGEKCYLCNFRTGNTLNSRSVSSGYPKIREFYWIRGFIPFNSECKVIVTNALTGSVSHSIAYTTEN